MPAPEEQFGGPVPDCYDDFVTGEEGVEGFVEEAGKTEISDFDFARGGHHDVCGFEIAMEYPVGVEVLTAVEELEHDGFDGCGWDGMACRLSMVVDDLEEIMLCVFENHKDAFIFEDDLDEPDDVHVA